MKKIVYVEWRDGRPFSVGTVNEWFDVDWCEKDKQLYYHEGGGVDQSGGDGLDKLPPGVTTMDQLIEHYDIFHGETVACQICGVAYPDDDLCQHITWNEEIGWWDGPGYAR